MIGNNTIVLNTATMIEAVQFWLDSKMPVATPKVTGVKSTGSSYDSTFEVSLSSPLVKEPEL